MSEEKIIISAREFTKQEIEDGIYIVNRYKKLSRTELAKTICEGIDWYSPNGNPKTDAGFIVPPINNWTMRLHTL